LTGGPRREIVVLEGGLAGLASLAERGGVAGTSGRPAARSVGIAALAAAAAFIASTHGVERRSARLPTLPFPP
jgi:hypothetical protein